MEKKFIRRLVHGGILLAVIVMVSGCGTGPDNPPGGDSQFAFGEQPGSSVSESGTLLSDGGNKSGAGQDLDNAGSSGAVGSVCYLSSLRLD